MTYKREYPGPSAKIGSGWVEVYLLLKNAVLGLGLGKC